MELNDRALPLTRAQLDIWLAQETGHSGSEWQGGLFVRIEGTVERDALERAIRQALQEAEPVRAAIFEVDGQVFQRAIDYPDVELAFYDLSCSRHPVRESSVRARHRVGELPCKLNRVCGSMRDIEVIDSELRLLVAAWRVGRQMSGCTLSTELTGKLIDKLLDERAVATVDGPATVGWS